MSNKKDNKNKKSDIAKREEEILKFWQENKIFEKSLEKDSPNGDFVFYEGPPTANARPGIHHLEARAFKDVIPRYKTMRGYYVRRKAGWDTHGLPVELEVEKELGLKNKKEIEEYGVAEFNKKCQESVWKYKAEWETFTERIAFWVDKNDPYITYKPHYIESLWNIVSHVWDKKLLYKDYKVVPWCPRCGTAISSHEVAQGYKEVKDTSVTVEFELVDEPGTSLLAWTTTPWTLLGNVALAVNPKLDYVKVEKKDEGVGKLVRFILAKDRLEEVFGKDELKVIEEFKGDKLVGRSYKPLFSYFNDNLPKTEEEKLKNAYKVYPASFVTVEDGTGIVHTAVMYGAEDFELGTEVGLPKHHLVGAEGKFTKDTGEFKGIFVKDADKKVIEALGDRLFAAGKTKHTYPFCWRCDTPLIYYARDSWYIRMSELRDNLVDENKNINWEPAHLREGRFGEWLREIKDWAISRERYWGTPLPIWSCDDCGESKAVGSIADLNLKSGGNKYFVMRHGGAKSNREGYLDSGTDESNHVTEEGQKNVLASAKKLKSQKIDIIISSPVLRAKETAEIVSKELGVELIFDERLREKSFGKFELKPVVEHDTSFVSTKDRFEGEISGGENLNDLRVRLGEFLYEVDSKYKDKNILLVSHGSPIYVLNLVASGIENESVSEEHNKYWISNSEFTDLDFTPVPHNSLYELDLHRPYIDEVELDCVCGAKMSRVKEVMDVWFDSGAMPFAQDHYPFENKELVDGGGYPADFISEAIDQTRGWFYTLHAIGVLLGRGKAYKNVISLGHVMDKHGRKMSKTKGNAVNPWDEINEYGADTLRFWMYTVNQPGESKNYDSKTVGENLRKVIKLLENIHRFYETYAEEASGDGYGKTNVLDEWIVSKLGEMVEKNTKDLENYKILEPARRIRDFINDFSTWYIRRSRDRYKGSDKKDKKDAILTTKYVLLELSKLMAPFMPFISEELYRKVGGKEESVHLDSWPEATNINQKVLEGMVKVRKTVTLSLEARSSAGIKVRQPLGQLKVKEVGLKREYTELIKDEVNVKEILFDENLEGEVALDLEITPELQEEGNARELIRQIQSLRKEKGLKPSEVVSLNVSSESDLAFVEKFEDDIKSVCGLKEIKKGGGEKEIKIGEITLKISIN